MSTYSHRLLQVLREGLVANIQGGDQKYVSRSSQHTLDGSHSFDQDQPKDHIDRYQGFSYEW